MIIVSTYISFFYFFSQSVQYSCLSTLQFALNLDLNLLRCQPEGQQVNLQPAFPRRFSRTTSADSAAAASTATATARTTAIATVAWLCSGEDVKLKIWLLLQRCWWIVLIVLQIVSWMIFTSIRLLPPVGESDEFHRVILAIFLKNKLEVWSHFFWFFKRKSHPEV